MKRIMPFPSRLLSTVNARPLLILLMLGIGFFPMALAASETTTSSVHAAAQKDQTVRVSADQQIYDVANQKYVLKGNVKANFQNLKISSSEAVMEMDATGKPNVAKFLNRPTVIRTEQAVGEDSMTADVINIYLEDSSFGAEGNVLSYITTVAADPFTIRSDVQQFDNKNKLVSARGGVSVKYKDTQAYSPQAFVRMKENGKAERVVFSGGARIKKNNGEVVSEKVTVMVDSGNLIAEQGVRTKVVLPNSGASPGVALINSDYQQYDEASGKMIASGNVKIVFGDYVATGPKATFNLTGGDLKNIFLTGRPTIIEQGRKITADKITITTNPKNFDAVGNVKVQFQTAAGSKPVAKPAATPPGGKAPVNPAPGGTAKVPPPPKDDELDY